MRKLSVSLSGHQTSVSIEPEFFVALQKIAAEQGKSIAQIIGEIDAARAPNTNLSSEIRVWILKKRIQ